MMMTTLLPPMANCRPVPQPDATLEHIIELLKQAAHGVSSQQPDLGPTINLLKRKTVPELVFDGPQLKRQRNDDDDELRKVCLRRRDPRRDLLRVTAELGSKHVPNQRNLVNTSICPGNLNKLGTIKPQDIFTNNSRNTADHNIMSGNLTKETRFACVQVKAADPVRPGKAANTWSEFDLVLDGYNEQQKADIRKKRARRLEEQNKLFRARKLSLVLDLDHTLLNSVKFEEVDPPHHDLLRKIEEHERGKPEKHLFRLPQMRMWTKLRPGIWKFLEMASKLFELHIYTMGNKRYATEMAKLLDPKGELFCGRIISRGDDGGDNEKVPKIKDMEGVLGMDSSVVIIDDTAGVWPHNKRNLINVDRYIYFPSSRRQLGLSGPSLLEVGLDENREDGSLASALTLTERIHEQFFANESLDEADVRVILASEQRKILAGCRILFSRIFPVGEANPDKHPLWLTAERFGAVCTTQIDDQVTHVVARSLGTDKVNWALSNGRCVVHPRWVEASAFLYKRANEKDFVVRTQR